jgi:hypothetical protein
MVTPLRTFLLAVLKSTVRRSWIQRRVFEASKIATRFDTMGRIDVTNLTDSQAAAYLWLVNRSICNQLSAGEHSSRVYVLDGGQLAGQPESSLRNVTRMCGIQLDDQQLALLTNHPFARRYSKDLSRHYDATSRLQELSDLELRFGAEAETGIEWLATYGVIEDVAT